VFSRVKEDIKATFERDPAAKTVLEILLCYPGLHAIWLHRISHFFYRHHWTVLSRLISEFGRFITGIEIHPGATIGHRFFIDHGAGVVIGETTEIGDDVLLYQGATLGGTGKEKGKRHPTLKNNIVVGTGAKVLGNITIGDDVKIGAGSVVLRSVPDGCTVVGVPAKIVNRHGKKLSPEEILEHGDLPDPEWEHFRMMQEKILQLERRLNQLEKKSHSDIYGGFEI
jgi:serine O-acetyltransferase